MPKRYTEAELMEFENCPRYQASSVVRELTDYIRKVVGTAEIPQFQPLPSAVERSIIRHRRKLISERVPASELRRRMRNSLGGKSLTTLDRCSHVYNSRK